MKYFYTSVNKSFSEYDKKVRTISKILYAFLLIILMLAIIINPTKYISAAIAPLKTFSLSVLPAIFPFMILTSLFIQSGALTLAGSKWINKIFRSPDYVGPLMLIGLISGYPLGAKLVRDIGTSSQTAFKLFMLSSFCGPVFVLGTVGASFLKDSGLSWIIYISHVMSGILCSLFLRNFSTEKEHGSLNYPRKDILEIMADSVNGILSVGGFMLIFSMLNTFAAGFIGGERTQSIVYGILEMTEGAKMISSVFPPAEAAPLICGIISFGGLCVIMQTYSYLSACKIKLYKIVLYKLFHGAISAILCFCILKILY